MANVEHSSLSTGELHEPKGIASATSNSVYIANGAGSGAWRTIPNGYCYYSSPVGVTYTAPSSFTKLDLPTVVEGVQRSFSHNGAGRLTYIGADAIGMKVDVVVSFQATASAEVDAIIFINGLPSHAIASTHSSGAGQVGSISLLGQFAASPNDYVEVYIQASSGDLTVENFNMSVEGRI